MGDDFSGFATKLIKLVIIDNKKLRLRMELHDSTFKCDLFVDILGNRVFRFQDR